MLYTLLAWDVLSRPPLSSGELTFRLILAFLLLVAGLILALMPWNK
jgi:hypothetical protein